MNSHVHHYMRIAFTTSQNCSISYFIFNDIAALAGSAEQQFVDSTILSDICQGLDRKFILPWSMEHFRVNEGTDDKTYDLIASVNHYAQPNNGGHYTAIMSIAWIGQVVQILWWSGRSGKFYQNVSQCLYSENAVSKICNHLILYKKK